MSQFPEPQMAEIGRAVVTERSRNGRGRRHQQSRRELSRFEQDLRAAKNNGKKCVFYLPFPTDFTDDECMITAKVLDTDQNTVKIQSDGGQEIWISCQGLSVIV